MVHEHASEPTPAVLRPIELGGASGSASGLFAGRMPQPLTSLVGREEEIAAIGALLVTDGVRLLTVIGPGGVGKTRLALAAAAEIAGEFLDGAAFVPLAAVRDPSYVLPAIAQELGIREAPDRPLAETLTGVLKNRHLLLVLDNVEHVAAAAVEVADLLTACPRLTLLVTSRVSLKLGGERRFAALPLALPPREAAPDGDALLRAEAVALFVQRARHVEPAFELDAGNAAAVAEICRRLEGLPLAIELGAAWVRVLPPAALLARLAQRLPLLRGGGDDQPPRLRTMRDAIAWSYDLLAEDEATLFRRLAVFVGGFTLEAAEWVTGEGDGVMGVSGDGASGRQPDASVALTPRHPDSPTPSSTLDLLAALLDKSLVQLMPSADDARRYQMLEVVREYALERLTESGEAAAAHAAHAAYLMALTERLEPELLGPRERRWFARCDAELGNLRAALAWSLEHDPECALRIGAAVSTYWCWYRIAEGKQWLSAALSLPAAASPSVRRRALASHAAMATLVGDIPAAFASGEAALALARDAGDSVLEAQTLWNLGAANYYAGNAAAFDAYLERALALWGVPPTSMQRAWAAYARSNQASAALVGGETGRGIALFEDALARAERSGSEGIIVLVKGDYGGWLIDLGEPARARGMLEEALALAAMDRGRWLAGAVLAGLALVDAVDGRTATAACRLGAVEAIRELAGLFMPLHYQQRLDRAAALARAALGDEAFAAAWASGYANPDAVIANRGAQDAAAAAGNGSTPPGAVLTPRERDVLRLVARGGSDKEIAVALGVGRRTVSTHVAAIRAKLDAPSRSAAAAIATRDGLI